MERLTSKRNGANLKVGYWSKHRKEELVQKLGEYEDLDMSPSLIKTKMRLLASVLEESVEEG